MFEETMSLLWNQLAIGRANTFRSLLRSSRPSIVRDVVLQRSAPQIVSAAYYHRNSKSRYSVDATIRKIRRLDKRTSVDKEAMREVLSPQQEALQKLGILNDKLRSTTDVRTEETRQQPVSSQPPPSLHVRLRSVHAAQTFDVVKILSKVFTPDPTLVRHTFGKTSLICQLKPLSPGEPFRFVAVYRFGSVVFFNMTTRQSGKLLDFMKQYGSKSIAAGFERRENFGVVVQPQLAQLNLQDDEIVTGDYCVVESLDMNSVSVIASIMAQTVALDSFNDIAEELLASFASINTKVKQTGKFTDMEKDGLFRVVAQNNAILIEMMSKLGIKERSEHAWNLTQYATVHEGMKEEFEIEDRFNNIEFKLDMIQQNAKFFLEILHNQKTNTLEWIIIVLILFECILMILEMSGMGIALFDSLPPIQPSESSTPPTGSKPS